MHNDRAVNILLRMEGAAFALIALWLYSFSGLSWWWFALFILAPDLSMAGYLLSPKAGAAIYNAAHTWVAPILLGAIGWFSNTGFLLGVAFVWAVHIGVDRALGYGLKMESGFRDTHLGRIGREDARREA
jgi:hypothetical protein